MLIASGGLPRPRARPRPILLVSAAALSTLLHGAALLWLLQRPGRELPEPAPPLEIEMIQQQAELRGAPPPPAAPPDPAPPAASASPPSPPPPGALPAPAPQPAPPEPPQKPPEVNLGNALRDVDPLTVTGENVVPAGPDPRYRNQPPRYPAAAARIGAAGTVQLVIHIAPTGQPLSVGIVNSSGNADLDEEARRAVMQWHFRPAMDGRRPVPFDYVIDIRFALGDR